MSVLPRLLQDPQLQPAQLGSSIVACFRMQQQPLGRALLRLLLQDGQLFVSDSHGELARLTAIRKAPALQLQKPEQQQLLDTLLAADTSNARHVAAAIWLAAGAVPDKRQQWEHLLDRFMQVLPQATTAAIAAVLGAATAVKWELPAEQLEQLLAAAEQQLPTASAVDIRLVFEAAVTHRVSRKAPLQHNYSQLYTLLTAFHQHLPSAHARDVYGVLSAAAVAGARMPNAVLQDLFIRFTELLPEATHWDVTGVLWSVATLRAGTGGKMAYRVHAVQLTQLVAAFLQKVPEADAPRSVSKVLWAIAVMNMGHALTNEQLKYCDELWAQHWRSAEADAERSGVYRVMHAFGQLQYLPKRLLAAADQHLKLLQERASQATMAQLSAVVMAFANWGYSCAARKVFNAMALQRLQEQGAEAFGGQAAANLAWANAVLSISGHSAVVRPAGRDKSGVMKFAAACREVWGSLGAQEKMQLHQVHLWLRHLNQDEAVPGLKGVLSRDQLSECAKLWHADTKAAPEPLWTQHHVFGLLLQLPASTWQQAPALEQRAGSVGAMGHFIDIAAVRADGKRLAIEVDGPKHFIRPSNRVDGPTQCRNLLLELKGWTVVSIPYFEYQIQSADQPGFNLDLGF